MENKQFRRIAFSDRQMEMINEIKNKMGTRSISEVLRQSVFDFHRSLFPAYKNSSSETPEIMEKKAKNKILMKDLEEKAREEMRLQPLIFSCVNDFKGKVEGDVCKFTAYGVDEKYDTEEEISLESCSKEVAEARVFLPSKEAVLGKRSDLKKIFN